MKTIAFLDNTYPEPYQVDSIGTQALGGTEASVIRTAQILSSKYSVLVAQKSRTERKLESDSLKFIPKTELQNHSPDVIVVLRKYPLIKELHMQFPKAKLFLWLHTYKGPEWVFKRVGLAKTKTTVICNSNTHKAEISNILNNGFIGRLFGLIFKKANIHTCYNPIPKPNPMRILRDSNQLIFFSSPNKGLDQVLKCFEYVKAQIPKLKLLIANPGYKQQNITDYDGVEVIGSLPHDQMMRKVAGSLCVFYPQDSFAETFGLIYAEANSYGTPVIAHDIGAAKEILHENNDLIDANDYEQILQMIIQWQEEFPKVAYKKAFSKESIMKQWQQIIEN